MSITSQWKKKKREKKRSKIPRWDGVVAVEGQAAVKRGCMLKNTTSMLLITQGDREDQLRRNSLKIKTELT